MTMQVMKFGRPGASELVQAVQYINVARFVLIRGMQALTQDAILHRNPQYIDQPHAANDYYTTTFHAS